MLNPNRRLKALWETSYYEDSQEGAIAPGARRLAPELQ